MERSALSDVTNNTLPSHTSTANDVTHRGHTKMHVTWIFCGLLMLQCICMCLGEPRFSRRYGPPIRQAFNSDLNELFTDNASNPKASAKEYLDKFGWVVPPDWTAVSPRFNESIQEGGFWDGGLEEPTETEEKEEEPGISNFVENQIKGLSEKKFEEALKNFQQSNGLIVTGILDEPTVFVMTQPRCGVPDQTAQPVANQTEGTTSSNTTTTSSNTTTTSSNTTTTSSNSNTTSSNSNAASLNSSTTPINPTMTSPNSNVTSSNSTNANLTTIGDYQSSGFASGEGSTTSPPVSTPQPFARPPRVKRATSDGNSNFYEGFYDGLGAPLVANIEEASETAKSETPFGNFVTEDEISEAELSYTSRVESMKDILEELRRQKIGKKAPVVARDVNALVENVQEPTSEPRQLGLTSRMLLYARERKRRSIIYQIFQSRTNGWGLAYSKKTITWRLMKEWPSMNPSMSANEIWFTIKLAFRMWSEILPRNFREDNTSPVQHVDILIGFGTGRHNRCPVDFRKGPFMQEYAHAWPLPKAEMHFNDIQPFVPVSWVPGSASTSTRLASRYPISLLKVAVHEIGHTLGLPHSQNRISVMNPYYKPFQSKDAVELGPADRQSIKNIYGTCNISHDAVFDWVRQVRTPDGVLRWKFNTYFFRKSWYWLYDNRANHPRYGDPKLISQYWRGVISPKDEKLDGVVHVREWGTPLGPTFFFKGDSYTEYDNSNDRAKIFNKRGQRYPRKISEDFPGIPTPIDSVFYKWDEGLLYFFKGNYVYRFSWNKKSVQDVSLIWNAFPGWGGASPLPGNIDSTYYSYTKQAYYFFKGIYFWKLAGPDEKTFNIGTVFKYNAVGPKRLIFDKWKDLCDVDNSELVMTLPTT